MASDAERPGHPGPALIDSDSSAAYQRPSDRTVRDWLSEVLDVPMSELVAAVGVVWWDDEHPEREQATFACWRCRRVGAVIRFSFVEGRGECLECRRYIDAFDIATHVKRDRFALARLRERGAF